MQCRRYRRCWFDPWVTKILWRRTWQSTPVFLPGESHGQRSLAGYSPWGCKKTDTTEQLFTFLLPVASSAALTTLYSLLKNTSRLPPTPHLQGGRFDTYSPIFSLGCLMSKPFLYYKHRRLSVWLHAHWAKGPGLVTLSSIKTSPCHLFSPMVCHVLYILIAISAVHE